VGERRLRAGRRWLAAFAGLPAEASQHAAPPRARAPSPQKL